MQSRLEKAKTVDELMQDHIDFLDTCLKECMLTNSRLLKVRHPLILAIATIHMIKLTILDSFKVNVGMYLLSRFNAPLRAQSAKHRSRLTSPTGRRIETAGSREIGETGHGIKAMGGEFLS
jgi:hypothetical protein